MSLEDISLSKVLMYIKNKKKYGGQTYQFSDFPCCRLQGNSLSGNNWNGEALTTRTDWRR